MQIQTFYTHLTRKDAELLLLLLQNPGKMSIGQMQKRSVGEHAPFSDYKAIQRALRPLISQKLIVEECSEVGEKNRYVYQVETKFLNEWRKERLRLKLVHLKHEHDLKTKIPVAELYDANTCKYFLL